MIDELVRGGNFSEFELRRIDMSVFRLFDVLLGLIVKSATELAPKEWDSDSRRGEGGFESALIWYERTYRLVEKLSCLG